MFYVHTSDVIDGLPYVKHVIVHERYDLVPIVL
jgi:hypothetical protein